MLLCLKFTRFYQLRTYGVKTVLDSKDFRKQIVSWNWQINHGSNERWKRTKREYKGMGIYGDESAKK